MSDPATHSYTARDRASWATGDWSSSGKAHLWMESPFNPKYARSSCGIVAATVSLQAESEALGRCARCKKAEERFPATHGEGPKEKL